MNINKHDSLTFQHIITQDGLKRIFQSIDQSTLLLSSNRFISLIIFLLSISISLFLSLSLSLYIYIYIYIYIPASLSFYIYIYIYLPLSLSLSLYHFLTHTPNAHVQSHTHTLFFTKGHLDNKNRIHQTCEQFSKMNMLILALQKVRVRPLYSKFNLVLFTNPSARAGYDTRSIFKRSLTGLNLEFSFS